MTQKKVPSLNEYADFTANKTASIDQKADGILAELRAFKTGIESKLDDGFARITTAVQKPEKVTDRFLHWWASKRYSALGWLVLLFLLAVAYSVGGARAVG